MDYFNKRERKKQKQFAAWRDRAFNPLIKMFSMLRSSPNHITIFAIICLIVAVLVPPRLEYWWLIGLFLLGYCVLDCILDGFDGLFARHTGETRQGEAMVDMATDQIGMVLVMTAAAWRFDVDPWGVVIFSTSYIGFIMLTVDDNQHQISPWRFLCLHALRGEAVQ